MKHFILILQEEEKNIDNQGIRITNIFKIQNHVAFHHRESVAPRSMVMFRDKDGALWFGNTFSQIGLKSRCFFQSMCSPRKAWSSSYIFVSNKYHSSFIGVQVYIELPLPHVAFVSRVHSATLWTFVHS